jgi:putative membrane protein
MREILVQWFVAAIALLLTGAMIPGFRLRGAGAAFVAAFVIGLANVLIRPLLLFLTLPLNLLTFGLFTWVVNAIVLKICAALTPGFEIRSWWSAIFGAISLSLITTLMVYILYGFPGPTA